MAHGIEKLPAPVKAAMGQALAVGKGQATTHYPLPTTHYPLPTKKDTISTTHYPLPTTDLDDAALSAYERRVRRLELMRKLRRREREAEGAGMRKWGVVLVLVGVGLYFWGGGKFKLPFLGEPDV